MKIIKLKPEDILLLKSDCKSELLNTFLLRGLLEEKSGSIILILPSSDIEIIEEELLKILMEKGTDVKGEINELGKQIDDLIDKFNHYD